MYMQACRQCDVNAGNAYSTNKNMTFVITTYLENVVITILVASSGLLDK